MVTFWAILKNITLEVKTAVATFWASLCKNLGNILFQHLVRSNDQTFIVASVTRFGEISPLWQSFKRLWQFVKGLFRIWEKFAPTLTNFLLFCAKFQCCKWPKMEKVIQSSGHTDRCQHFGKEWETQDFWGRGPTWNSAAGIFNHHNVLIWPLLFLSFKHFKEIMLNFRIFHRVYA